MYTSLALGILAAPLASASPGFTAGPEILTSGKTASTPGGSTRPQEAFYSATAIAPSAKADCRLETWRRPRTTPWRADDSTVLTTQYPRRSCGRLDCSSRIHTWPPPTAGTIRPSGPIRHARAEATTSVRRYARRNYSGRSAHRTLLTRRDPCNPVLWRDTTCHLNS